MPEDSTVVGAQHYHDQVGRPEFLLHILELQDRHSWTPIGSGVVLVMAVRGCIDAMGVRGRIP